MCIYLQAHLYLEIDVFASPCGGYAHRAPYPPPPPTPETSLTGIFCVQ